MPEDIKVYIHHLNFCQLKLKLKENEAWQEILQEIRDYDILKKEQRKHILKIVHYKCSSSAYLHQVKYCTKPQIYLPYASNHICHTRYHVFSRSWWNKNNLGQEFVFPGNIYHNKVKFLRHCNFCFCFCFVFL